MTYIIFFDAARRENKKHVFEDSGTGTRNSSTSD